MIFGAWRTALGCPSSSIWAVVSVQKQQVAGGFLMSVGVSRTLLLVWQLSKADHRDHAVLDVEMEAGCAAGRGEFVAVCGDLVHVGSLHDPPGRRCSRCCELTAPRKRRRRRWIRWLA